MSMDDLQNDSMPESVDGTDSVETDALEDISGLLKTPKLMNSLLERTVEQLTTVHKRALRDNGDPNSDDDIEGAGELLTTQELKDTRETRIEQLKTVYRKVARDNADLKCQLMVTVERVKALEVALKETNAGYLCALDRIGRAVSQNIHVIPSGIPGEVSPAPPKNGEETETGDH